MSETLLSMTGYGELARDFGRRRWRCVVQSVNSRYLDCRIRLPQEYISFEPVLKNLLKRTLIRGKVDLVLSYETVAVSDGVDPLSQLDVAAVKGCCSAGIALLRELGWSDDEVGYRQTILSFSLQQALSASAPRENEEGLLDELKSLVSETLDLHRRSCLKEGSELLDFFVATISDLTSRIDAIAVYAEAMPEIFKERLYQRITRLVEKEMALDETRLCQEVAHQVDRSDISEELLRFKSHLKQFSDELASTTDLRKGKKLDFIVQELGREINTITAKANLLELTREAVEIKAILEQVREQVQNVV